jgi:hypothetical protein
MRTIRHSRARRSLDQVLTSAVVLNWKDLMGGAQPGLIHIEYHTDNQRSLQYLKVWSSTAKGYWQLVCEYWVRPGWSHPKGLAFADGRGSADFASMLRFLVTHQHSFSKDFGVIQGGLVQVNLPTEDERIAAERLLARVMQRLGPRRRAGFMPQIRQRPAGLPAIAAI